jgi:hypothetical protein
MRILPIILLVIVTFTTDASTLSRDTIDNWQVYNGENLLFAGNGHQSISTTLKRSEMVDISIQFNHCQAYLALSVTIELINEANKKVIVKTYKVDSGNRVRIPKAELEKIDSNTYKIRYRENIKDGTDIILGQIKLIN